MLDAPEMLQRFMTEKGLSQTGFANKYGFSQASVSAWLRRQKRPNLRGAVKLERVVGIKAGSGERVTLKREEAA